ncbi:MAG: hypothetical protein K0Q97_1305 [Bacillota bacterium]|jgi:hypothetical protein|nr:hypothetical protein [Bacillota bacterium]
MSLFGNLFKKDKKEVSNAAGSNVNNVQENTQDDEITAVIAAVLASMDDEETVAAIMAAITSMLGTSNFIVRNIKRSPDLDSVWAQAGRMKLMR